MDLLSRVIRLINSDGLDRIVLSHGAIVALAVTPAMGWQDLLDGEYSSILVVRLQPIDLKNRLAQDKVTSSYHRTDASIRQGTNTEPCGMAGPVAPCGHSFRSKLNPGWSEPSLRKRVSISSLPVARSIFTIQR